MSWGPYGRTAEGEVATATLAARRSTLDSNSPPGSQGRLGFEDLVYRHGRALYRMAYRLTGNEADAEDLTQDTVLEALRTYGRFQPGSRFDSWAFTIMRHRFIDRMRRLRRHPMMSLDAPEFTATPDPDLPPDEAAIRGEQRAFILRAMADLPPEFRLAIVLVDVEGLSYEEASHIMGCRLGTVRSRLHRGRSILRCTLAPLLSEHQAADPSGRPLEGRAALSVQWLTS